MIEVMAWLPSDKLLLIFVDFVDLVALGEELLNDPQSAPAQTFKQSSLQ